MSTQTDEINEIIIEAFKWWDNIPPLANITSMDQLYQRDGHFYDPDTRRFFGTRNPHLAAPGITVELQTRAPEGMPRYSIHAWVMDDGKLESKHIDRAHTLREARRLAVALHKNWPT